jgi:hypothetical protein
MGKITFLVTIIAGLILSTGMAFAQPNVTARELTLLSVRRPILADTELDLATKQLILSQFELTVGELYVNREVKIRDFRRDAVAEIAALRLRLDQLSTTDFHNELFKIVNGQYDLHLNYRRPRPVGCYASYLPFSIAPGDDGAGNLVFYVRSVIRTPAVNAVDPAIAAATNTIVEGDSLIQVDGRPAAEWVQAGDVESRGANPGALQRRSAEIATFKSHAFHSIPTAESHRFRMLRLDGSQYEVVVPWISRRNTQCLNPRPANPNTSRSSLPLSVVKDPRGYDEYQLEYIKLYQPHWPLISVPGPFGPVGPTVLAWQSTSDNTIRWQIVNTTQGPVGVIRLDSFVPQLNENAALELIGNLFANQFANTIGLVFDLRGNGGGSIRYAEALPQLMDPRPVTTTTFRLLNTELNRTLFTQTPALGTDFRDALIAARPADTYTASLGITPLAQVNRLSQRYFKPVSILTDGSCYSACDMFTAVMQDLNIATVISEDRQTGAGGANVITLPTVFAGIPIARRGGLTDLPLGISFNVAWRQTLRTGARAGAVLENEGVVANLVRRTTPTDATNSDQSLMEFVAAELASRRGRYISSVQGVPIPRQNVGTSDWVLPLQIVGTDRVTVARNGSQIADLPLSATAGAPTTYELRLTPSQLSSDRAGRIEVLGFLGGQRVWRQFSEYRRTPSPVVIGATDVLRPSLTVNEDPLWIITTGVPTNQGWQASSGKLVVGNGTQYAEDVETEASFFLDLSQRRNLTLSFDADIKTEENYDIFEIVMRRAGQPNVVLQAGLSGTIPRRSYSYDLSAYAGQNIEIAFSFIADSSVPDRGVTIENLVLQ